MPRRAGRICANCRRVLTRPGPCPTCRARREAVAPSTDYSNSRWQARSKAYLADHPTCALCPAASKVVDHHPLSRRTLRRIGVPDPDADEHVRPLCLDCHRRETNLHQPGGWAAQ